MRLLVVATHRDQRTAGGAVAGPVGPADGAHVAVAVNGNVREGEEHVALLALREKGGQGER